MNETEGSNRKAMQPDATSSGRLLSASDQSTGKPQFKMTRSAKRRVRIICGLMTLIILATGIAVITILLTANKPIFAETDESAPLAVPNAHVRCKNDVIISEKTTHQNWRHSNSKNRHWHLIPTIRHTGYVLISPRLKLEAGYPGVLLFLQSPGNNTRFHVVAVSTDLKHHSKSVSLHPGSQKCGSIAITDPKFFKGDETVFKIYVYYASHFPLHGIKPTVTSLPTAKRYKSLNLNQEDALLTTRPEFKVINAGERDYCSTELIDGETDCNWWNMEDGDGADFIPADGNECIDGGARSEESAIYYLGLKRNDIDHETRALLISPIIKQETPTVSLILWYLFKCNGPRIRIHRIPAEQITYREALGSPTLVAEITSPADHLGWELRSFKIALPEIYTSYQIVIEGIVANWSCSCRPFLAIDSMALDPMHERCRLSNGSNIMDCSFQTNDNKRTMCEWTSSVSESDIDYVEDYPSLYYYSQHWKHESTGFDRPYSPNKRHLIGRGLILMLEATGKFGAEPNLLTPLLTSSSNCSCVMKFMYLMRGKNTPRLTVSMVYIYDPADPKLEIVPQWSLFGHQSDEWMNAVIPINLRNGKPFLIEIRVHEITKSNCYISLDDIMFEGCDMRKYP